LVVGILAAAGKGFSYTHTNVIYPGVFVGSISLGGLTKAEAAKSLETTLADFEQNGLTFVFRDRNVTVPTVVATTEDPDLSYELMSYDLDAIIEEVDAYGRSGNFLDQWQQRLFGIVRRHVIDPNIVWKEEAIRDLLKENLATLEHPAQDAEIIIRNGTVLLSDEKDGIIFNYDRALSEARSQLKTLVFSQIPLKLSKDTAELTAEKAEPLVNTVKEKQFTTGVTITHEKRKWFWPAREVNNLIEIRLSARGAAEVGISEEKLTELIEPIQTHLAIEPQEPKFALEEGKVIEFKTSTNGQKLIFRDTWKIWEEQLLSEQLHELAPIIRVVKPKQGIADVNNLGITELLGVGKSSFAGSPSNRRHNIRIGAEAVNGTLIPPDEEFSLLATLGTIDGSTGYKEELVIKGNETIPEFGGGLCQIGTTTFRGTLDAGLKVTARRNHSYSVSYYYDDKGKPGTDATIYDPAPDYRFKNDTKNHVLITTRIDGDDLYFEYWGTKDGRKIVQSDTRTWDIVQPPDTKYVETLDLPVDEVKCTESPHAGIKAEFDYTVTYEDGTVNEETFKSQYRPWQEVCLIGVEELSPEAEEGLDIEGADLIDATI
jgi:vancomycin resistance protein YoaR